MEIDYQTIYNYLNCGKCPAGLDACVKLQAINAEQREEFFIKDGVLHYITNELNA